MLYDIELEQIVLGTLVSDKKASEEYCDLISVDLFYEDDNKVIAKAILDLFNSSQPVDIITIFHQAKKNGGNVSAKTVANLTQRVGSSLHFNNHLLKLKELKLKRNLNDILNLAHQKVNDPTTDIFDLMSTIENQVSLLTDETLPKDAKSMEDILIDVVKEIEYLSSQEVSFLGFHSGFEKYDSITSGFRRGTLNIIAARPAMGKTSLMTSIVLNGTQRDNRPALIFSLEMNQSEIMYRILSSETEINSEQLRRGNVTGYHFTQINNASSRIMESKVYIHDDGNCNINTIRKQAKRLIAKYGGVSIIAIDYLQLMKGVDKNNNREQEIAGISRGLKLLSKELDCPIVALAQLSRQVESRSDKKPMLSDLRESGSIEQDADTVSFLYRPEYYNITEFEDGDPTNGIAVLSVAKNRNGRTGEARIRFIKEFTKFTELTSTPKYNNPDQYIEPLKPNIQEI